MSPVLPKVSVVTISFRDIAGLERTLSSVRAQRGEFDLEHVVIDGGSGDAVSQYLRGNSAALAYWQSRPDGGRYDAMNQGNAHATGDVVWFMHSGDRFADPDAIAAALHALGPGRRGRWGFGRANLVDGSGGTLRDWGYRRFRLRRFALGDRPIPHQAAFFGADLVRRVGPYDVRFGLAADQLYMLRTALHAPPVVLDRAVCDFDTTGAGSTRSVREHYRDVRRVLDETGYFPLGGRRTSMAGVAIAEGVAGGKLAIRRVLGR
ncbi:glycosyltransferase [Aldersonia sp. NBC_00410]|uniref:glycosyltransferase n=1 Tax=Aldersonia sp. NBC_00410 TaxID=2975954 RepID=UPI002253D8CA|nr:glycosyltransferase [Aldersonia sp. NBC_00410]MCX5041690.1 glycosyltransferase [Aldersonia sp. NBC_00410]